ncbi:MAG: hypothetical protein HY670_11610, partial [Chloroflexi bacterium]|nr:hypothetical protein [Chloroflexota bacterium]
FCVSGERDKVIAFFRDVLGAKIGPEMPHLAQWGHRARIATLGEEEPFLLEISESINDMLPIGGQHKRLAPAFQAIGLEVDDLEAVIAELRSKGIRVSDKLKIEDPSVEEMFECTIHPKSAYGLLVEFLQVKEKPKGKTRKQAQ